MRREILILVLLIVGSSILTILCIHEGHNWGGDFAQYISQAKSLVEGSQDVLLAQNTYAMENSDVIIGPYLYPIGFPLLLYPVYYMFGMDLVAMKVFCAAFFILCLPLIFLLFHPKLSKGSYALFIVAGIGLHESFLLFTDNILTAFPFLFFLLLSFLLMERSKSLIGQLVLGALIFYTFSIRDIGIALLPALFVYQMAPIVFQLNKERKSVLFYSAPYLSFASFFMLRIFFTPNSGESRYDLFSISDAYSNFVHYSDLISNYLFDSNLSLIFLIPMWFVIITGMVFRFKRDLHIISFLSMVLIIYIFWPFEHVMRFLFPLIPFLLYFLIEGVQYLAKRVNMRHSIWILFLIVGLMSFRGVKSSIEFSKVDSNEAYSEEMRDIYQFISQNVSENELIGFEKPRVLRLFTDRNAVYQKTNYRTDYLLLRGENNVSGYKGVYSTANYTLYKRRDAINNL